jgi:hypothetical protein
MDDPRRFPNFDFEAYFKPDFFTTAEDCNIASLAPKSFFLAIKLFFIVVVTIFPEIVLWLPKVTMH